MSDKQSQAAITWMTWEQHERRNNIHHAGNDREQRILKYKVDEYYVNDDVKIVFELN